jgi:hypothetical protein
VGHSEPFFGEVVEIFRAHSDPQGRILYRASAVAKVVGCTTSAVCSSSSSDLLTYLLDWIINQLD